MTHDLVLNFQTPLKRVYQMRECSVRECSVRECSVHIVACLVRLSGRVAATAQLWFRASRSRSIYLNTLY